MTTTPTLKWCPGARGRLAATGDGRLVRFYKTADGKPTNPPRYEIITPRDERHQLTIRDSQHLAQWWICAAYHGLPKPRHRVEFIDGNRSNFRPENLRWRPPSTPDNLYIQDCCAATRKDLARRGEFRPINGAPEYFVSRQGKFVRITAKGALKPISGTYDKIKGTLYMRLPGLAQVPAKEIVADVWLPTPRPTPYHRTHQINADPKDIRADNLRWEPMQRMRRFPHRFRPENLDDFAQQADYIPQSKKGKALAAQERLDARHEEIFAEMDRLATRGAKQLKGCPRVWITPDGLCIILADERTHTAYPNPGGYILKVPGLDQDGGRLHLPTAVADAFAGTQHAPNLPDPCPPSWTVKTIDGSTNCHPANLVYRVSNHMRPVYFFKNNDLHPDKK